MRLARGLAEIRRRPVQDQVLEDRGARGIVAEGLAESQAKSLATALGSAGIPCAVGPASALVELPPLESAATIEDMRPNALPAQGDLQLVRQLVAGAPDAWLKHGARVLLEGRPVRAMGDRSLEDLGPEARWLLILGRFDLSPGSRR